MKPLHYFIAAYEERSISSAAVRCFISQPSISHAIKSLENNLGTSLFIRSKTGIIPTEQGHKLYQHGKLLLEHNHSIEREFKLKPTVNMSIFFQGDISLSSIQPILKELNKPGNIAFSRVSEFNQCDIAFVDGEQVGKRFSIRTLYQESFSVLFADDDPIKNAQSINLNDLKHHHFIERPYCSQQKAFKNLLRDNDINLNLSAKADNDLQVMELVALGFGITAMPSNRIKQLPQGILAKPIDMDFTRDVVLAYRNSRQDIKKIIEELNWEWIDQNFKKYMP